MGSNNGFTIITVNIRRAQVYNDFYNKFARRIFTIRSQSAFYNNFYNIHTDTLFPVPYPFFYLQYTQREFR